MEEMCVLKSYSMSVQYEEFLKFETLDDRIEYFLNYNMNDSDVSDNVEFVVDKERLVELLDKLIEFGVSIADCTDEKGKVREGFHITPEHTFKHLNIWWHDRLEYFVLSLNDSKCKSYCFIGINYEQMKKILIGGFTSNIIMDITHPCWKF